MEKWIKNVTKISKKDDRVKILEQAKDSERRHRRNELQRMLQLKAWLGCEIEEIYYNLFNGKHGILYKDGLFVSWDRDFRVEENGGMTKEKILEEGF